MRGAMKGAATFAIAAPLAVWAVPAFDCAVAIVRRKMTGRKISATDRGHLHHCVLRRGFGSRQMLFFIGGLCLVTALGAVASVALDNELYAAIAVVAVIATLVVARIFGYAELVLAAHTFRDLGTTLIMPAWLVARSPRASSVRLQGTRDWERPWRNFFEAAQPLDLYFVRLHLNLPWLHESFHASWHAETSAGQYGWKLEVPLMIQGRQAGHLLLKGSPATTT
jgi:UDP-GlcNAc:undecaprenyl-phosphate GlcNAc-1-phosphate transferase